MRFPVPCRDFGHGATLQTRYSDAVRATLTIAWIVLRQVLSIAIPFWGGWLVLALAEATVGSHPALGIIFSLSLPLLVGLLTWSSLQLLVLIDLGNRILNIAVLGTAVLVCASSITGIGLMAAASFKQLVHQ
jgi:hypothetical protein